MKHLYLIVFILTANCAMAQQYGQDFKRLADQAFANHEYYEAAYYYKKVAKGMGISAVQEIPYQPVSAKSKGALPVAERVLVTYRLADSYRMYENYQEAESWYLKTLNEDQENRYPLARLWYGVCLRANQKFDEAITQLTRFAAGPNTGKQHLAIANRELANSRYAKEQYQKPGPYTLARMKDRLNADGSNYALYKRDDNLWFTSSRILSNEKKRLNRIYHVVNDAKPEPVSFSESAGEIEYGTPSFDPSGRRMYLTRWFKSGKKIIQAIYCSTYTNGNWSEPVKLNNYVNAEGSNSIQPYVSDDGRKLFFSSDKPGGRGGKDIWVSDLNEQGQPVNASNLGAVVNTDMDDQAPWYDAATKKLMFSSKGHTGLGGFDLFESIATANGWATPSNMGYPVNSSKDDLYFFSAGSDQSDFYVSSDRQSECCLELFQVSRSNYRLSGTIVACESGKILPGVELNLTDVQSKKILGQWTTGNDAAYSFSLEPGQKAVLSAKKDGFFSKTIQVDAASADGTSLQPSICLQAYQVGKAMVISNILYDFNGSELRPESKAVLNRIVDLMRDNPEFKIELSAHTDSIGSDAYNLRLSQERAQACVDYVISKGIDAQRLFAKGYGESNPIAPNTLPNGKDNPEGRQLNRRTEFTVLTIAN